MGPNTNDENLMRELVKAGSLAVLVSRTEDKAYDSGHHDGHDHAGQGGQDGLLEDRQGQDGGISHDEYPCSQKGRYHTAGSAAGHNADHRFLFRQVDAVDGRLGHACYDTSEGDTQSLGAERRILRL